MNKKMSVGVKKYGIIMLILGLYSFLIGINLFIGGDDIFVLRLLPEIFTFTIPYFLVFISGFIYIFCGIYLLLWLRDWIRKVSFFYSIILLIYTIPLALFFFISAFHSSYRSAVQSPVFEFFVTGKLLILFLILPYVIFPLIFIFNLNRLSVKEQFK